MVDFTRTHTPGRSNEPYAFMSGASHAAAPQKCQYVGACTRAANERARVHRFALYSADILERVRRFCGIKSRDERRRNTRYNSLPRLFSARKSPATAPRTKKLYRQNVAQTCAQEIVAICGDFFCNKNPIHCLSRASVREIANLTVS